MDSPVADSLMNVAGRGVGVLAALTTLKQPGGLANYMLQRQRALADPGIRATFAESPFAAGTFQVGGETYAPHVMPTAAPADFLQAGQPIAGPRNVWLPHLAPLTPETALKVRAQQEVYGGLESSDELVSSQAKLVAGIPLNQGELGRAVALGREMQAKAGPGSTVQLDVPGMRTTIGSPYVGGQYL